MIQFISCNDDIAGSNNNGAHTIHSLTGTVSNLSDFLRNVRAYVITQDNSALIDTQFIGADTMLNITLTSPPLSCLENADYYFPGAKLSDNGAKVNGIWLEMYDDFGNFYGLLSNDNRSGENFHEEPGFFVTRAVYSDRYVIISGGDTVYSNTETTIYKYNMTLGHGWNLVTKKINAMTGVYTEYELTSGGRSGSKWYFDYAGLNNTISQKRNVITNEVKPMLIIPVKMIDNKNYQRLHLIPQSKNWTSPE